MKMGHEESLLRKMGVDVQSPDSGCCGMAGAFGFEADKYAVSQAVGERVLLPAVRDGPDETLIVSDGFSCREQIRAGDRAAARCTWRRCSDWPKRVRIQNIRRFLTSEFYTRDSIASL